MTEEVKQFNCSKCGAKQNLVEYVDCAFIPPQKIVVCQSCLNLILTMKGRKKAKEPEVDEQRHHSRQSVGDMDYWAGTALEGLFD